MKRSKKLFFKSFIMSSVILSCLIFGALGTAKAYENTLRTGFGEYKTAVEFSDGCLRILDFEIRFY